jgi:hypothetical protein
MDIRKYFKPLATALEKESQPIKYVLDEESWIEQGQLPNDLVNTYDFNEIWRLHPEDYSELFIMGKTVKTPRWVQNYLRSYQFSGRTQPTLPLPKQLELFLMWANIFSNSIFEI